MDGKYSVLQTFHDSMVVSATGLNFVAGQYKKIFDKMIEQPLTTMYSYTKLQPYFDGFQRSQKVQYPWLTNPYPFGDNEITSLAVEDYDSMVPPYIPGGEKWKFEVRVFFNNELLGGGDLYVTVRNQRSLLEGK